MQTIVRFRDAASALSEICKEGRPIITFSGYSGSGYRDREEVERIVDEQLTHVPAGATICSGATTEGIGLVYALARRKRFRTIGIVSSQAEVKGVPLSPDVETIFVVEDATWGGLQGTRLSPVSEALVTATDLFIAVGGGDITRDEIAEARRRGKSVKFFHAEAWESPDPDSKET